MTYFFVDRANRHGIESERWKMRETIGVPSARYALYAVTQAGETNTESEQVGWPETPPNERQKQRDGQSKTLEREREIV